MKLKTVTKISILIFILLFSFSYSQESPTVTRHGSRIIIENDDYLIDWELETLGHVPKDPTRYIVEGNRLISKGVDRTIDIAFISPAQLHPGSKVYIWRDVTTEYIKENSYMCDNGNASAEYGWITVGEVAWCNMTFSYDGLYGRNDTEERQDIIEVTPDYFFDNSNAPDNVSIYWNETYHVTVNVPFDVTSMFNYANRNTTYGDNIYYVDDATFKADKEYRFRLDLKINNSDVPLKYTMCFGDIQAETLYFCLDPVIDGSRSWTTSDDFTNGTVLSNITALNNEIKLSINVSHKNLIYYWDLDSNKSNVGGVDFTKVNNPDFVSGKVGDALDCNATKYLEIPGGTAFYLPDTDWTYSLWVKYQSSVSTHQGIFGRIGDTSTKPNPIDVYWSDTGSDSLSYLWGTDAELDNMAYTYALNTNWHFWTFRKQGTNYSIYRDGSSVASKTSSVTVADETSSDFELCDTQDGALGGSDMLLDELSIYNRSLSDNEISALYDYYNGGGTFPLAKTQGLYEDLQEWTSSNDFDNISIEMTTSDTSSAAFAQSSDNSTFTWTGISTNGTNVVSLSGTSLYYKIQVNDSGEDTAKITSYTIYETDAAAGGDSCDTNNWDCSESCTVDGLDAGGNTIYVTNAGKITITADVTNCATSGDRIIRKTSGCDIIRNGGELCP